MTSLKAMGEKLLDLLFTPRCVGCGHEGRYLCQPCLDGSRPSKGSLSLSATRTRDPSFPTSPTLDGVHSCYAMEGAIREAVHHLKHQGLRALAPTVGKLLAERAGRSGASADAVVPVPLHRGRRRERGYNQAELLAREVGRLLGLPLLAAVRRVGDGPPQARAVGLEARLAGVQGGLRADHGSGRHTHSPHRRCVHGGGDTGGLRPGPKRWRRDRCLGPHFSPRDLQAPSRPKRLPSHQRLRSAPEVQLPY